MAEFALGLTKTAVAGTVSMVKSAIEEEEKLRVRMQNDLLFITGEFQMMQAFLSTSGARESASKNKVVRTWVRQLRDLAFDVEDCVEFIIHLDNESPWIWLWRVVPSCMAPQRQLDQAVAEIKHLKARVDDVSQRNTRYIASGGGDGDDDFGQELLRQTAVDSTSSTFHILRKVWEDAEKLHDTVSTDDLKRLIDFQGDELQVISLWDSPQADGAGELEWTAIVKEAYDDPAICQEFKNRVWIKPAHPFNQVEFLNTLLTHFTPGLQQQHHDDMSELVRQVREQRYLIVLDQELASVADWEAIRPCLPDGNNGSRIIVCTRHLRIALACTSEPYQVWELKRFFRGKYLYAFSPKGSGHRIGMRDFFWKLRRPGVISVLCETDPELRQFFKFSIELRDADVEPLRVLDVVNCDHLHLADWAQELLFTSYPGDLQTKWCYQKLGMMSSQEKIERCRKFLSEHDCLFFIDDLRSTADWDLIKRDLLPESTRGCVVVTTQDKSVATHCADDESRVLNAKHLLKCSDKQGHRGRGDQGVSIKENVEFKLVGREHVSWDITGYGTRSVWGIPGVGKSAFVREKYNWIKNHTRKYRMHGWVDVPHPFNLIHFCWRLLLGFYLDDVEAKEAAAIAMMEGQDPTLWCRKILHTERCLLVVDGLESKHDWDSIEATLLPQRISAGTTIVIITREESIAAHCTKVKDHIFNLTCLEAGAATDLLKMIAFDGEQLSSPEEEDILNLIMSKCGGLPEIITAVGGEFRRRGSLNMADFAYINANFMGVLEKMPDLRSLFCWLKSYFDACSDELKPCIFYMSVFPPHQSVRRSRLLRRWIAEGYSRDSSGGGATSEVMGEKLFSELMELSILYQEKGTTKVNGFFHGYIKSRPMEDNLVFALEGHCHPSSRLTGKHLTISNSWDRDEAVFNSIDLSRLRSLTVFGEWKSFLTSEKMKLLRVLDLEGTNIDGTTSVTDDDLEKIGKRLHRLKFLSLRGCQQITCLPDSLGDMRQLETLDVRYTSVVELPRAIITKLHKLQYIRAGTSTDTSLLLLQLQAKTSESVLQLASTSITEAWKRKAHDLVKSSRNNWWKLKNQLDLRKRRRVAANGGGVEAVHAAAEGIGRMTDLHTLGVVNIAGGKGAFFVLKELKKLTQLHKLGLSGINRKNWRELGDAISGNLHHLESLSLQLMLLKEGGSFDFACFDDIAEPPKTLKRLKVLYTTTGGRAAGGACMRPVWLKKLPYLERFHHALTISSQEDIRIFFSFGELEEALSLRLHLKPNQQQQLSFNESGYDLRTIRLDAVSISCSSSSSTVTFGDSIPVYTKELSIYCCGSCGSSPCLRIYGLQHIRDLKEVQVTGSCSPGFKEDLLKQLNDHPDRPVQLICDE